MLGSAISLRRGVFFANLGEPLVRYRLHAGALKRRKLRETAATTYEVNRKQWLGPAATQVRKRWRITSLLSGARAGAPAVFPRALCRRRLSRASYRSGSEREPPAGTTHED